jgi:hypothetical protein
LKVPHTRLSFHVSAVAWNSDARTSAPCSSSVSGLPPGSRYACAAASWGRRNHVSSGSLPFGLARASLYVVWRADATRTASALNVNVFLSFVKYRMCV